MEPEENAEGQGKSLNDGPPNGGKHFFLKIGWIEALALKSDDDPECEIEEAQEVAHVSPW